MRIRNPPTASERPRSSVAPFRGVARQTDNDSDEEEQRGQRGGEPATAAAAAAALASAAVFGDNVSYAIKSRLAFSPYLAGSTMDTALQFADREPQPVPEALSAARACLQRCVLQRLRELQLLTEWPLLRPRRSAAQMERLVAGGVRASELVGLRGGAAPMDHPRLPGALQGLCLLGPTDMAMALAQPGGGGGGGGGGRVGQQAASKEWMALSATGRGHGSSASSNSSSNGSSSGTQLAAVVAGLPRSLGALPGLPAVAALPWAAPGLAQLRLFFKDLHPQQRHVGVDDTALPWFRDVKLAAARALVAEGGARAAAAFAVFGVPHGLRAAVWETALGLRRPAGTAAAAALGSGAAVPSGGGCCVDPEDVAHFEKLCTQVLEQPLLLDVVAGEDAGPLVGDSGAFFLFEEAVRAMVLALLRDSSVPPRLAAPPLAQLQAVNAVQATLAPPTLQSGSSSGVEAPLPPQPPPPHQLFPPSGVLPHRGLSLLAAPLCYMYDSPAGSYKLFRSLYCRYWCKLHSLSSVGPPSPALPGLLRVFEGLMQELDPQLVSHLGRRGVLPASLVLPWLASAFAGALPVQEVLLLWDRVVGLDSLLPLPLLAAAILCFRRHVLLVCASAAEVVAALSDVTQLRVVPLMQAVLFPGPGPAQE